MEADWSVEIWACSHVIDASWEGFVNLRDSPDAVNSVIEAKQYPALCESLLTLNSEASPVFSTKCDTWTLAEDGIDPYEFGAAREDAHLGFASYVDIVERDPQLFTSFEFHDQHAREIVACLRSMDVPKARVDVTVRVAILDAKEGYGITLYVAGCGSREEHALTAWGGALSAAIAATITKVPRASSSIG